MNLKSLVIPTLILSCANLHAFESIKAGQQHHTNLATVTSAAAKEFKFEFPDIELIDHHNQPVDLQSIFAENNDVVFAFFFTHCVNVCTTITLSLKSIQDDLPEGTQIAMISIDPNTDTPEILNAYAGKHQIKESNWHLLTGDDQQIVDLQKKFEAYRGNKMNHSTSLFVKKSLSNSILEVKSNFSLIPNILKNN